MAQGSLPINSRNHIAVSKIELVSAVQKANTYLLYYLLATVGSFNKPNLTNLVLF